MIKQLIALVFASRNATHLAHWATKSYAEHVALGDFYEESIDILDKLVEAYQGTFGVLSDIPLQDEEVVDIIKHLSGDLVWMNDSCDEITKDIASLDNILQELQALYQKTLYKLKNLA